MDLLPHFGTIINPEIKKIVDKTDRSGLEEIDQSAMRAPRGKRKSKVIDTILSVLQNGMADAAQLKQALAAQGLSESSLATGLAILQKEGKITRESKSVPYGEGGGIPGRGFYYSASEAA